MLLSVFMVIFTGATCAPANVTSSDYNADGRVYMSGPDRKGLLLKRGDPNCKDKLDNCAHYGEKACSGTYQAWAETYCPATCGVCTPISTTPKPCIDRIDDCADYGRDMCTQKQYEPWVKDHCRYFCKKCGDGFVYASTTTISPENCYDKVDNCNDYGSNMCTKYEPWARAHCMYHCGFCQGTPTTPTPCVDKIDNCGKYEADSCTAPEYRDWAQDNCRATCKLCTGQDQNQIGRISFDKL